MSVTAAYQLNSIYVDTDDVADTTLGGIVRQTINTGNEIIKNNNSGTRFPETAHVVRASPSASFTTTHCQELFNLTGVRSMCITSAVNTGVHLWARKLQCSGIASTHEMYTFRNGIMIPMSLTCDHQGNASMDATIFGVETASLASMVRTADQAIGSSTTVNPERWTLYSVTIAGSTYTGIKGVTVDFGNTPVLESSDSDTAPTFASVQEAAPTVTLRGINPVGTWAAATGLSGTACTHANTYIFLKERDAATSEAGAHIKISMHGVAYSQQVFDANGNATGESDLMVECIEDSSGTAPLAMTFTNIT